MVIDVSGRFRVAALGREATAAVVAAGFLVETGRTMGLEMTAGVVLVVGFANFVVGREGPTFDAVVVLIEVDVAARLSVGPAIVVKAADGIRACMGFRTGTGRAATLEGIGLAATGFEGFDWLKGSSSSRKSSSGKLLEAGSKLVSGISKSNDTGSKGTEYARFRNVCPTTL